MELVAHGVSSSLGLSGSGGGEVSLEHHELLGTVLLDALVEAFVLVDDDAALADLALEDGDLAGGNLQCSADLDVSVAVALNHLVVEWLPGLLLGAASLADLLPLLVVFLGEDVSIGEEEFFEAAEIDLSLGELLTAAGR